MLITCKDGRKREGVSATCAHCHKPFETRADQPSKYCSKSCNQLGSRQREQITCAWCNRQFERCLSKQRQSKSGLYFCTRECKDAAQQIGGLSEIMPSHYGTSNGRNSATYRSLYKRAHCLDKLACVRCSYDEFECGIDVHHLDGDKRNNAPANLLALCAPCHRALHDSLWQLSELGAIAQFGRASDLQSEGCRIVPD